MDAEKWCKEHKNKYFQNEDRTERDRQVCYEILIEFAEEYHQSKVNNGVLDGVIKCDNCGCDTKVFAEIYGKKRLRYCRECA